MRRWWHEDELIDFCLSKNITLINYAPVALAQPAYLGNPVLGGIARAHGITPAQALLFWGLQRTRGVVIPRSANVSQMLENQAVFGLPPLTAAEMGALSAFPQKKIFNVYCQPWC